MVSQAVPAERTDSEAERYRAAERALWNHYGITATERFVDIDEPPARLRIVEVGSGAPTLFIPGTPGTGPYWARCSARWTAFEPCCSIDRDGVSARRWTTRPGATVRWWPASSRPSSKQSTSIG